MELEPLRSDCLDPDTRDQLARGLLAPAEAAAARAHVDACAHCRQLIDLLSPTHGLTVPGGGPPDRTEPGLPATLGRFRILDRLGEGGMGMVFRAHDPQLDRQVALKVMRPELVDVGGRERLLREARAQARLAHPNVVAIHEVGELDDGSLFLAMELIDGTTLQRWLGESRPRRAILNQLLAAGRGLAAAHAAGLVHRDFKPANVLCARDGRVLVADFGLARRQDAAEVDEGSAGAPAAASPAGGGSPAEPITRTGAVVGTPAYMAPEQHLGRRADARADQFAFAVAACEALSGAHPFGGGAGTGAIAERVIEGRRDPRPTAALPRRLRQVLDRALAVDPDRRWPSMEALLDALGRPAWWRRTWVGIGAAGLVVAGAAVVLVASRSPAAADPCRRAPDLVAAAWDAQARASVQRAIIATGLPYAAHTAATVTARLDAYARNLGGMSLEVCEAHHVRGDQDGETYRLRSACINHRQRALAAVTALLSAADRDVVERAPAVVSSLPEVDGCRDVDALARATPAAEAPRGQQIADLRQELAAAQAAYYGDHLERAYQRIMRVLADPDTMGFAPLRAEALHVSGGIEMAMGRAAQAEDTLYQAVAVAQAAGHDAMAARSLSLLAEVVGVHQHRFAEADRLASLARAAVDRLGPGAAPRLSFLRALADLRQEEGRFAEALATAQEALAVAGQLGEAESAEAASVLEAIAMALESLGRLDQARDHHLRALAMRERVLGPDHPDVAGPLQGLAIVDCRLGRCADGLLHQQRALALVDRTLGPDSHRRMTLLETLGSLHRSRGDARAAEAAYREAIALAEKQRWSDDPALARAEGNLASLLRQAGRLADAEALHRRALARKVGVLGPEHPSVGVTLINLSIVLSERGRHAEALADRERAAGILEAAHGAGHLITADAHYAAAESALKLRRYPVARRHAEAALAGAETALGGKGGELVDYLKMLAQVETAAGAPARARPLLERARALGCNDC